MRKIVNSVLLIALLATAAVADIPPPKTPAPPNGKQVDLFIDITSEVTEPTLVIKKSSSKMLRAALDEAEGIESDSAQTDTVRPRSTASAQTIIGGTFLMLAFVFGGVWLVRSKPSKTVIGLVLVALFATGSVLVFANIAPPRMFGISKNMLSEQFQSRSGANARGKVRVKIVDGTTADSDIKLLIPMDSANNEE
jgi:hypothetical protein